MHFLQAHIYIIIPLETMFKMFMKGIDEPFIGIVR